jgi:uncharacterized membrane protein YtjA (UPF0391 family)
MRLWSLVLLAIAALAAIAGFGGFRDDNHGIMIARVLLGVVLLLFAISLLSDRRDLRHDERQDH